MSVLDETSINRTMESLAYKRLKRFIYKARWSSSEVEHFVYLRTYGTPREFLGAHFGFRNPIGERFAFESVRKYGSELLRKHARYDPKIDCTMNFDFSQLHHPPRRWQIYLREQSGDGAAQVLGTTVENLLLPAVSDITTLPHLLNELFGDAAPFTWEPINGAIRAAHATAVARQLGVSRSEIVSALASHLNWIRLGLDHGDLANAAAYVDRVIDDWDSWIAKYG